MARRRKNHYQSNRYDPPMYQKLLWYMGTKQGLNYCALAVYFVFVWYVVTQTSQGDATLIHWLILVLLPIVWWWRQSEKKRDHIMTHSIAYVRTIELIEQFTPSRAYKHEQPYHQELFAYLNENLQGIEVEMEKQFGSSRADIAVDQTIGIEVKGPTWPKDLESIADKSQRYTQHFDHVIVVLFNVRAIERRYQEWLKGHNKFHPDIPVFRIDRVIDRYTRYDDPVTEQTLSDWIPRNK